MGLREFDAAKIPSRERSLEFSVTARRLAPRLSASRTSKRTGRSYRGELPRPTANRSSPSGQTRHTFARMVSDGVVRIIGIALEGEQLSACENGSCPCSGPDPGEICELAQPIRAIKNALDGCTR